MPSLFSFVRRLLSVICFLCCSLLNYAQQFVWGHAISGSGIVNLGYSVVDATGNTYLAGTFTQQADFDPGPGITNLTAVGDSDIFVCKFNSSGNFVWAIQLGSTGVDAAEYITQDALGNLYITGRFSGMVDFDPGAGTASLSAQAGTDAFVAKYDSAGHYIWATGFAESGNSTGKAVAVDASANVYVTGNFSGTVSFTTDSSFTALGGSDVFICKLNAGGITLWGDRIGGTSFNNATGIVADAAGNVYTVGIFQNGTIDLDPGPDSANYLAGTSIIYMVKLNTSGGLVWAIQNNAVSAYDLKIDAAGNLYTAGRLFGVADMDPGPGTVNIGIARFSTDYFWELNSDGGYVLAKSYGGYNTIGDAMSLNFDPLGNLYTAGGDASFAKWDKNGNQLWGLTYGYNNPVITIATDAMQRLYTAGNFLHSIDLDPGPDTVIARAYDRGIYFTQLAQAAGSSLPLTWISLKGHLNNRQQSTLNFTVSEENVADYTIEKSIEGSTFSKIASLDSKGNGTNSYTYTEAVALNQTAWYRILQTDIDKRFSYSTVVCITAGQTRSAASVFPVPARGNITLQITSDALLHTKAVLVDLKGLQMKTIFINDYNTPISLDNLPAGMYLLHLANGASLKIVQQ